MQCVHSVPVFCPVGYCLLPSGVLSSAQWGTGSTLTLVVVPKRSPDVSKCPLKGPLKGKTAPTSLSANCRGLHWLTSESKHVSHSTVSHAWRSQGLEPA